MDDELSKSLADLERRLKELEDELPSIAPSRLMAETAAGAPPPLPGDRAGRGDTIIVWDERSTGVEALRPPFVPSPPMQSDGPPGQPDGPPGQPGGEQGGACEPGAADSSPATTNSPAPGAAIVWQSSPDSTSPTGEPTRSTSGPAEDPPASDRAEELRRARGRVAEIASGVAEIASELTAGYDELLELSSRLEHVRRELLEDYERLLALRDRARPSGH